MSFREFKEISDAADADAEGDPGMILGVLEAFWPFGKR